MHLLAAPAALSLYLGHANGAHVVPCAVEGKQPASGTQAGQPRAPARSNDPRDDVVIKSPADSRQYRIIRLKNGLKACLISDPSSDDEDEDEDEDEGEGEEANNSSSEAENGDEDADGEGDEDDEEGAGQPAGKSQKMVSRASALAMRLCSLASAKGEARGTLAIQICVRRCCEDAHIHAVLIEGGAIRC